ncbi:hypothetical protein EMCRGX_G033601 [Ephydatia muelleri]
MDSLPRGLYKIGYSGAGTAVTATRTEWLRVADTVRTFSSDSCPVSTIVWFSWHIEATIAQVHNPPISAHRVITAIENTQPKSEVEHVLCEMAVNSTEDEDQWLYGKDELPTESQSPLRGKELEDMDALLNDNPRPETPTLDDTKITPNTLREESTPPHAEKNNANHQSVVLGNSIKTEKSELRSSSPWNDGLDTQTERKGTELDLEDEEEEDGDEDSDSEDDVQIHIGEIKTTPLPTYTRPVKLPQAAQIGGAAAAVLPRKVDLDAIPQIGGQSIFEYDIDADKPWRTPGADITDYFNYGFTEETWRLYCDKQRKVRYEVQQLNKIAVHTTRITALPAMTPPTVTSRAIPSIGLPTVTVSMSSPFSSIITSSVTDRGSQNDEDKGSENTTDRTVTGRALYGGYSTVVKVEDDQEGGDGRATPVSEGMDHNQIMSMASKPPLLPPAPPTSLPPPPPLPFPPPLHGPSQEMAAAMAAMMGVGGIRPPDLPPPPMLPPGLPPFPPFPGGPDMLPPPHFSMPHPFLPPGDHGPPPMDGFPPFHWDHSLGPPPPELLEGLHMQRDFRRSRSRSKSSSYTGSRSRSSSYEDEKGRKRKDRRHRRHSRSRSRDRMHRSARHHREYHRHERDRERGRERGRGTEIETEEGIKGEEKGTERRKGIEIVTGTETKKEREKEEKKDLGMREPDGKEVLARITTLRRPLPKPKKKERSLDQELLCHPHRSYGWIT